MVSKQSLPNGTYSGPATLHLSRSKLLPAAQDLLMQMGWVKNDTPDPSDNDFFVHCENSIIETDHTWLHLKSRQLSTKIRFEAIKNLSLASMNSN
jgi:hypothetical protein